MVIGMCIGACVPVLLSAIGANVNGKRAAFVYLYFNITGAVLLMVPFYILHGFLDFGIMSATATSIGIAVVNTVFKVSATVLLAPFSQFLERLAVMTIPDKRTEEDDEIEENLLDERFLNYPPLALEQSGKTMTQMTASAFKNLRKSIDILRVFSQEKYDKIMSREERVDRFEDALGAYLVRLNTKELSQQETRMSARYLNCLSNVERISDHAVNLAELAKELSDKRIRFSEQAEAELDICVTAVLELLELTGKVEEENDLACAKMVEPLEEVICLLTKELKIRHIQRVQNNSCTLELGFIYNDCLNNLERVAAHCSNIAIAVLESADAKVLSHDYLHTLTQPEQENYRVMLDRYADKYYSRLHAER
jgi:phosphate:Na+ symporter